MTKERYRWFRGAIARTLRRLGPAALRLVPRNEMPDFAHDVMARMRGWWSSEGVPHDGILLRAVSWEVSRRLRLRRSFVIPGLCRRLGDGGHPRVTARKPVVPSFHLSEALAMARAVNALSVSEFAVLRMLYLEGLSPGEAARRLRTTRRGVEALRVSAGRKIAPFLPRSD